jgi:hypothetical protein
MDPSSRDAGLVFLFRSQLWHPVSLTDFMPATVHHYTSAGALAGILKDTAIRATNFAFLNDPSEVQHGRDLVLSLLATKRTELAPNKQNFIDAIVEQLKHQMLAEVYVSCFSSQGDDLSQWRAYGSAAERYSLGFDSEVLEAIGSADTVTSFAKVLYDVSKQVPRAQFYIDRSLQFLEKNDIEEQNWPTVAAVAAEMLARVIPELKNSAYEHEQEWRLIRWHLPSNTEELGFDTSRGVVRPYAKIALPVPVPITKVAIMAPTRKQVALKGAEMLLRSAHIVLQPTHSVIPFAD